MAGRAGRPDAEDEERARSIEEYGAIAAGVIRIFVDYADSVVWFRGPLPYESTFLSPGLIAEMRSWEAFFYANVDDEVEFISPAAEAEYFERGMRIARAFSEEIGDLLPIEVDVSASTTTRVRASGSGTNPLARKEFDKKRAEIEEQTARSAALIRSGARLALVAPNQNKRV
jgi:hypothetical protein